MFKMIYVHVLCCRCSLGHMIRCLCAHLMVLSTFFVCAVNLCLVLAAIRSCVMDVNTYNFVLLLLHFMCR